MHRGALGGVCENEKLGEKYFISGKHTGGKSECLIAMKTKSIKNWQRLFGSNNQQLKENCGLSMIF